MMETAIEGEKKVIIPDHSRLRAVHVDTLRQNERKHRKNIHM